MILTTLWLCVLAVSFQMTDTFTLTHRVKIHKIFPKFPGIVWRSLFTFFISWFISKETFHAGDCCCVPFRHSCCRSYTMEEEVRCHSDNVDSNKREMLSGVRLLFFPSTRLKKISRREIILWFPPLQPARDMKWADIHNQTRNVSLVSFFNLFSKSKGTLTLWSHEDPSNFPMHVILRKRSKVQEK